MAVDYYDYIRSSQWRERANAAKQRAGHRCQICNAPSSKVQLEAHHRTYDRLGHELPEDITVLCRTCHGIYHDRLAKPPRRPVYSPPPIPPIVVTTPLPGPYVPTPRPHVPLPQGPSTKRVLKAPSSGKGSSWIAALGRTIAVVLFICGSIAAFVWLRPLPTQEHSNAQAANQVTETPFASKAVPAVSTPAPAVTLTQPPPVVTSTPPPTRRQGADLAEFSRLTFCRVDEFSKLSNKCFRSRRVFRGTVEKLYVSWYPSEDYEGATFTRVWTIDGHFIVESSSTNEYAYLEVATRPSLKPGAYQVELFVEDERVQAGRFTIE